MPDAHSHRRANMGKATVEPRTALQSGKVLGVDASVRLGAESDYRIHLKCEAETRRAEEGIA